MANSADDREILERAGFTYNFDFHLYFNRSVRKIFSVVAVDDHDALWFRQCIEEDNASEECVFYFNSPPEETRRKEIVAKLQIF